MASLRLFPFPQAQRVVSSNLPLPRDLSHDAGAEPAVQVITNKLEREVVPSGARTLILNHASVPTDNNGCDVEPFPMEPPGIVVPNGVNAQFFELAPKVTIPIHRTGSTDYVFMLSGELTLTTPKEAFASGGDKKLEDTVLRVGDVYVQRGTAHGWRNDTDEWVRFWGIMIAAQAVSTAIDGGEDRYLLPDVWDI